MLRSHCILLIISLMAITLPTSAATVTSETLTIGTKVAPPFVIKNDDGSFSGISIDLWRAVAADLGIDYTFRETSLTGLVDDLENGSIDVSVAALTATPSREERIDFSHPFYSTGFAIAVPQQGNAVWLAVKRFFSWEFLAALLALAGVLLATGFLLWLAERRRNPEMFGGKASEGIGASFWWAAVTMTTVGYGDKAPLTPIGRVIALVWMFASIIIISSFTAAIATSLTVSQLESSIQGIDDLPDARVSTVADSASAEFLDNFGINYRGTDSLDRSLELLAEEQVDAVVYDAPLLRYLSRNDYPARTDVLMNTFDRQDYAFAVAEESTLREPINRALLGYINSDGWQALLGQYIGR